MNLQSPFTRHLISEAKSACQASNEFVLSYKQKTNFIGTIYNNGFIKDIELARKAFEPSALYGHQHGRDLTVALNIRPQGIDIHEFDCEGIAKNALGGESTLKKNQASCS